MKELMAGYCANPPVARIGPRITKDAWENYRKNRGSFHTIFGDRTDSHPTSAQPAPPPPRVFREGIANGEKNRRGEIGSLFANYARSETAAAAEAANEHRPMPRVKYGGEENLEHARGSELAKILQMTPLTNRPTSSQFFNQKFTLS